MQKDLSAKPSLAIAMRPSSLKRHDPYVTLHHASCIILAL